MAKFDDIIRRIDMFLKHKTYIQDSIKGNINSNKYYYCITLPNETLNGYTVPLWSASGACSNLGLYAIHKCTREQICLDYINKFNPEGADIQYPIDDSKYGDYGSESMWLNPKRWDFIEFVKEELEKRND